jgi:hypothetical protein
MAFAAAVLVMTQQADAKCCRRGAPRARAAVRAVLKFTAERRPARKALKAVNAVRPKLRCCCKG